jgi:hypothetical protein
MECKGCKKEIIEEESKKVGVWNFCTSCFEDLLANPSPAQKEAAEPQEPIVLKGEKTHCTVCEALLEDGAGRDMGILTVCEDCYQEMIARPEPIRIQVEEPETESPKTEEEDLPLPDPMETVPCTECKRTIRKIAAKIHDEDPYCPDCFYKNDYQNHSE